MIAYKNQRLRITGDDYWQSGMPLMSFPHCGIEGWAGAIAIGATAAIGAGATAYAASSASASAANAQAQNAANVSNTNQLNYQQFLQSRGSTGSAIYPIYASNAEKQLYNDTLNTYDATGNLQPNASQLQALVAAQQPSQNQANAAGAGIFNGQLQQQLLQNQQPVYQAQLQAAQTQKQGTLEALQGTLNNIKAIQAGKGYAGDSFGNQMLNFQARQGANTNIANAFSQANLNNASAVQGIKSGVLNTQLNNLNLPGTLAANNVGLANLASNSLAQQQGQRQQLFNNFRIGTGQFQYQNLPQVNPIASTGQLVGQGVGALGSAGGNYLANQQLISQLSNGGNGTGNSNSLVSPNSLGSATYYSMPPAASGGIDSSLGTGTAFEFSPAANTASLSGSFA